MPRLLVLVRLASLHCVAVSANVAIMAASIRKVKNKILTITNLYHCDTVSGGHNILMTWPITSTSSPKRDAARTARPDRLVGTIPSRDLAAA